jgi:type VI secretion system secreted protein Hcp
LQEGDGVPIIDINSKQKENDMKRFIYVVLALAVMSSINLTSASNTAATEIFVNVAGVRGETVIKSYEGWIIATGFSHGISSPVADQIATGSYRTGSRANFEGVTITKYLDSSSPILNLLASNGKMIPKVEIHFVDVVGGSKMPVTKYELINVLVGSISTNAGLGQKKSTESVMFYYERIKQSYSPVDASGRIVGNIVYSWNLPKNTQ